ncbi:hypothetical protein BGZ83_003828 [Gryganskiella cystojenkinii]|nr:hypothetical protein BGZ83_003828 [Gryganskiella cystojenkinii]
MATERIHASQDRVFGAASSLMSHPSIEGVAATEQERDQQHLQRRRGLTLADLDDRQRLIDIRERMTVVRNVCTVLDGREKQLEICVQRHANQDLGEWNPSSVDEITFSSLARSKAPVGDEDGDDESRGSKTKSKGKGSKDKDSKATKENEKEFMCGFDYSLVWDDAQDMQRLERANVLSLASVTTSPAGSRSSSVAPPPAPSFGVLVVTSAHKKHSGSEDKTLARSELAESNRLGMTAYLPLQLENIGHEVCMIRRHCDRHSGWQKLKAAELVLEKTLQNKLLKSLKTEAKLVKGRMKRRRNDLSAGILNGTIEH